MALFLPRSVYTDYIRFAGIQSSKGGSKAQFLCSCFQISCLRWKMPFIKDSGKKAEDISAVYELKEKLGE